MTIISSEDIDYQEIASCLKQGGIIIYPTDTAYALGCDATNEKAVEKIFQIKGRSQTKTLSLIAANRVMAEEWLIFSDKAQELADRYWPGPLTLVLPVKKAGLASAVIEEGYVGMRVPASAIARQLSQAAGVPIVATSANASGAGPGYTLSAVKESLGAKLDLVDLVIAGGELPAGGVSTLVKVWDNKIEVLRQGVVNIDHYLQNSHHGINSNAVVMR